MEVNATPARIIASHSIVSSPRARPGSGLRRVRSSLLPLLLLSLVVLAASLAWRSREPSPPPALPLTELALAQEASREQVEQTCATCHAYPPPELFPRLGWPREVERGFRFLREGPVPADTPSFASVVAYYQRRAPESLPVLEQTVSPNECPLRFERTGYRPAPGLPSPGVANIRFVHLSDERKLDVLACDMLNGKVFLLKPYEPAAELRIVTDAILHPAHAEVIDLNGDGIKDLVVANLGSASVTDKRVGSVVWLKGLPGGSFTPVTLAGGLGRVADAQAADFDGDGDLDLVVAEFGWLKTGRIVLLENRTTDASRPVFALSTIDPRHGAIHVPVIDLNGDGRPDFVALFSQEHETVVAFLNAGDHRYRAEVIYAAPHPAFGSSGIQLIDLDGDGDRDVLLTNGDSTDAQMLRPYHGVQWLENQGSYPFLCHRLTSVYGVNRAVAGDLDGDGDLDILAVCFLPGGAYRRACQELGLDAVILLEQTAPGRFVRHSLETVTCDHATCDLGDFDADGKLDLVTGNLMMPYGDVTVEEQPDADWVILRKNLGRPDPPKPPSSVTSRSR
jgi:FG-GAP-like repeat